MNTWFWRPILAGAVMGGAAFALVMILGNSLAVQAWPLAGRAIMGGALIGVLGYGLVAILQGRR